MPKPLGVSKTCSAHPGERERTIGKRAGGEERKKKCSSPVNPGQSLPLVVQRSQPAVLIDEQFLKSQQALVKPSKENHWHCSDRLHFSLHVSRVSEEN
jgi:hypothetical protein